MWGWSLTSFRLGAAAQELKQSKKLKTKKKNHDWWEGIMKERNKREQKWGILPVYFEYSTKNALLSLWVFACTSATPPPTSPLLCLFGLPSSKSFSWSLSASFAQPWSRPFTGHWAQRADTLGICGLDMVELFPFGRFCGVTTARSQIKL